MAGLELSDDALMAVLRGHPELRKRVSSIVLAVEGDEGELTGADAAEERLVGEMRLLDGRRCTVGPRPEWRRRSGRFVNALRCISS